MAGVHAANRLREYGTAGKLGYRKRGRKGRAYTRFLVTELLPFLQKQYRCHSEMQKHFIAGCSLGGLSALDIAWHNPQLFEKVGVFSGSFWWRSKSFEKGYDDDSDRIMHQIMRQGPKREGMKFWLQTGTNDERYDRNGNGVIDSIDDTLDLIQELQELGYSIDEDIAYVEIKGGEHNFGTWGRILPEFLKWAFQTKKPVGFQTETES